jgi:hypothetical protein
MKKQKPHVQIQPARQPTNEELTYAAERFERIESIACLTVVLTNLLGDASISFEELDEMGEEAAWDIPVLIQLLNERLTAREQAHGG